MDFAVKNTGQKTILLSILNICPMNFLKKFATNELRHYHSLAPQSKTILISILFYSLASPILSTFISAFLWRVSQSVHLVVWYNIAIYLGVPIGFYLNGRLLKHYNPTTFYFWGSTLQGVMAGLLLFLPIFHISIISLFGLIFGITSGLYWSNRIFINHSTVKSHQRIYFTSLIFICQTACNVIVPLVIGWYLVLGERTGTYSPTLAYQLLGIILLLLLIIAGFKIKQLPVEHTSIPYTTLRKPSRAWKRLRIMKFLLGVTNSIDIVFPTLLILMFIGKEGRLGTIQALSGVFLAAALYQIARKVGKNDRYFVLLGGIFLSILGGLIFSTWYSPLGIMSYFVLSAFATPIRWTIIGPVSQDVIDGEARKYSKNRYAFIFDQELFINLGRLSSLLLFIVFYAYFPTIAVRFTPLLFAIPQLGILYLAASLEKHLLVDELNQKTLEFSYVQIVGNGRSSND
jgi:MFS transporter, YQGE family, putative transporter